MNFIDMLRIARVSRVAVMHEFWTQYDPQQRRIHTFFEGHDDVAFFASLVERFAPPGARVYVYRCEGKARVYETFNEITQRIPDVKLVLFFVDKDLDDILGVPWTTDPRIFVTDFYSIENYLVTKDVLRHLYRDSVRLAGITFDETAILTQYEAQLAQFYRRMLPVMAWILMMRRRGERLNLANLDVGKLCPISESCDVTHATSRLAYLHRTTGSNIPSGVLGKVLQTAKELKRMPPKRILRGKFEAWFFVEFWKKLLTQLQKLAQESNGKVQVKVTLEQNTFVPVLVRYMEVPRPLELFLKAHFSESISAGGATAFEKPILGFVWRWLETIRKTIWRWGNGGSGNGV